MDSASPCAYVEVETQTRTSSEEGGVCEVLVGCVWDGQIRRHWHHLAGAVAVVIVLLGWACHCGLDRTLLSVVGVVMVVLVLAVLLVLVLTLARGRGAAYAVEAK